MQPAFRKPTLRLSRKRSRTPSLTKLIRRGSSFLGRSSHSIKLDNEEVSSPPVIKVTLKKKIPREYSRHAIEIEEEIQTGTMECLVN